MTFLSVRIRTLNFPGAPHPIASQVLQHTRTKYICTIYSLFRLSCHSFLTTEALTHCVAAALALDSTPTSNRIYKYKIRMAFTSKTVETFTVFPTQKYNRPLPPSSVKLSALDSDLCPPIHILNHRYYHPSKSGTANPIADFINKLKSSLAQALELYPPVAGTVRAQENGEVYIAMDAESILGTPFIVEIKDVPYTGDTEEVSPRTVMLLPPESSTLAVKVTQFSCGTVAIGSSIHHQVADLRGFLDFLELWAKISRAEPVDFIKIPTDWTRDPIRFFPASTRVPQLPPGFMILPPASGSEPPPFIIQPAVVTRWKVTKSALEQLKNDFSHSSASSDSWISSGDALSTLLWGVITRAREHANIERLQECGRSSVESQTETLVAAADGRDRALDGKMADGKYFGNVNPLFATTVARSDLLSLSSEPASRVALEVRNSLNRQLSPLALAEKILFLENANPGQVTLAGDVVMTNWCRFDLQGPKLDFGEGKPFLATAGASSFYPPAYVMLTQDKVSGDIAVLLTIEREGAKGMKNDSLLNKYATLVQG